MSSLIIRNVNAKDLPEVLKIEEAAWPEGTRASHDQIVERLEVYPEGFWVAELDDRLVAALTSQRINYSAGDPHIGWDLATNYGWIKSTHRPDGNSLHGVSLGVMPNVRQRGIGSTLFRSLQAHATELRLDCVLFDSRVPHYHIYENTMSIEEYVVAIDDRGNLLDPELRLWARYGFKPLYAVSDSMEMDFESKNCGVKMIWVPGQVGQ